MVPRMLPGSDWVYCLQTPLIQPVLRRAERVDPPTGALG